MQRYEPAILRVDELSNDSYPVTLEFQGASWFAQIHYSLPLLREDELRQAAQRLERGFIDRDYAKDFGQRLFQTLMPAPIEEGFRRACERAASQGAGIRVVLSLPPDLAPLPWELMYDPKGEHGFLARSSTAPLARHFPIPTLPHALPQRAPLRVLVVAASPSDLPPLSAMQETQFLQRILEARRLNIFEAFLSALRSRSLRQFVHQLRHRSLVETQALPHATRLSLEERLLQARRAGENFHVVHFIGHGAVIDGASMLLLEKEDGSLDPLSADEFAELVDNPELNLVVLNACQTADPVGLYNGVAQAVLRRGVPAAIGMQVPVVDEAAVRFTREFYTAWAAGEPLESALAYARRLLIADSPAAAADWGIPVLYMGPRQGLELVLRPAQIPTWPRRALNFLWLLIGTLIPLFLLYQNFIAANFASPQRMKDGHFNVAVADFSLADDLQQQGLVSKAEASDLSETIFAALEQRVNTINEKMEKEISGIQVAQFNPVKGDVGKFQRDSNAQVIIYGRITQQHGSLWATPAIYIYPGLTGAEELGGPSAFGTPVRLGSSLTHVNPQDFALNQQAIYKELAPRYDALSMFLMGVNLYKGGNPSLAQEYFSQAMDPQVWPENSDLNANRGKELLYLWIGSTALDQVFMPPTTGAYGCPLQIDDPSDPWLCAYEAYNHALGLNPNFARAHLGLGRMNYDYTRQPGIQEGIDACAYLEQAINEFQLALAPEMESDPAAFLDLKATMNIGMSSVKAYSQGCGDAYSDKGLEALQHAFAVYEQNNDSELARELGAQTSYHLGRLLTYRGDLEGAAAAYEQVIAIAGAKSKKEDQPWQSYRWNAYVQLSYAYAELARAGSTDAWQKSLQASQVIISAYEGKISWYETLVNRMNNLLGQGQARLSQIDPLLVGEAYLHAGEAQEALGDPQEARQSYAAGLGVEGIEADIRLELENHLQALGGS